MTLVHHLGGLGHAHLPPLPRNFFFNSKVSEMDSGAIQLIGTSLLILSISGTVRIVGEAEGLRGRNFYPTPCPPLDRTLLVM